MIKKITILMLALFGFTTGSIFAGNSAGCGLGSTLLSGQSGLISNLVAVSINGISSHQTFGITSGTSGCKSGDRVELETEQELFIADNSDMLKSEMIQGQGEFLGTYAVLMGCESDVEGFSRVAGGNHEFIFEATDSSAFYDRTVQVMNENSSALSCQ